MFWRSHNYLTEGFNWCQAAIARVEEATLTGDQIDRTRAEAYTTLAMLAVNLGDHSSGQRAAKQAVALARQLDDPLALIHALNFLGFSSGFLGDVTLAFESLHESEELCRSLGFEEELANVLQALAYLTMEVHGPEAMEQLQSYMEESLALSQGSTDPDVAVRNEGILARLALYRGELTEARIHADR